MNVKSLLPFQRFTLSTRLPLDEVKKRLSDNCDPSILLISAPFGATSLSGKPYGGTVNTQGFEIFRVLYKRTFHLPVIKGTFDNYLGKTEVQVAVQPQPLALLIYGVLCVTAVVGLINPAWVLFPDNDIFLRYIAPLFIFLNVARVLYIYNKEVNLSADFLLKLLDAERVDG